MGYPQWSPSEDALLKKWVGEGKTSFEIHTFMPNRTKKAINHRRYLLKARSPRTWSPEEEAELKKLVEERLTCAEIAKIMGRTKYQINSKKERLGLYKSYKLSPRNPLHVAEIIKFKMAGWTHAEIAEVYGCDLAWVSLVLCSNGIKNFMCVRNRKQDTRRLWTETEEALLRKYLKKGYTFPRIRAKFQYRSPQSIRGKVERMTRFWLSPEELEERQRLAEKYRKRMRVY